VAFHTVVNEFDSRIFPLVFGALYKRAFTLHYILHREWLIHVCRGVFKIKKI